MAETGSTHPIKMKNPVTVIEELDEALISADSSDIKKLIQRVRLNAQRISCLQLAHRAGVLKPEQIALPSS